MLLLTGQFDVDQRLGTDGYPSSPRRRETLQLRI
jgi:hypothetical protein